jgi:hypothetical protein
VARCPFGEHAIHPTELPEHHTDLDGRAQAPLLVVLIRDEGPQVAHLHGLWTLVPTATLPYADAQVVPLPVPQGAAVPTAQLGRVATRGNCYNNLSNQGTSLSSLWTHRPTFAATNDGNLPTAAPSAFRTVNSAELPATGTTSGQLISLASITGTGAQVTTTARSPSPECNPTTTGVSPTDSCNPTTTGVSPTDSDLLRPVLAGPDLHPARTGAAIFSDRVTATSRDSIRIHFACLPPTERMPGQMASEFLAFAPGAASP